MKRTIYILLFSFIVIIPILLGMATPAKMTDTREKKAVISIETEPNLEIHEGYVSQKEETVLVKKGRKTIAQIYLSKPVVVAMAEQEEKWGYFQFPFITRTDDNELYISWQMAADSHKSIGIKSNRKPLPMVSEDNGKTWKAKEVKSFGLSGNIHGVMSDGNILQILIPTPKDIHNYTNFPKSVGKVREYTFYPMEKLPDELQGVYLNLWDKNRKSTLIHARINDPGALRYSIDGVMPIPWSGTIRQLSDGSLVAGVYPSYYLDDNKLVKPCGVAFYRSKNSGYNWDILGKIPFEADEEAKQHGSMEFDETAFEILQDSTFICVMRSGSTAPLFKSYSYDRGKTWTKPVAFTPNGVKPKLMLLDNGVLALVSGRPGVQIRFSTDGTGNEWTEPIEMMPFMKGEGSYTRDVSCGYGSIIKDGPNSFFIVYSDFMTKDKNGNERKSIWFRKVLIKI